MIYVFVAVIFLISVMLAMISLKKEKNKKEVKEARDNLKRGKVIYYSSDSPDSSS